jgi:truncated hemoglobin YjbI
MPPTILACVVAPPTLYEWAGGADALSRMINAFYDRVEADDLLSPFFPGGVREDHRRHVALWWGEVFGGPPQYTEELGGYQQMLSKHPPPMGQPGAPEVRCAQSRAMGRGSRRSSNAFG